MNDEQLDRLVDKLGLDRKVRLLTGATTWRTAAEPDLGLRAMVCSDGPAGVRGESWDERRTSALLPSASALGALWDEELLTELGRLLAAEAIRKGVHVVLAPTLNLHRSPLGGRHFECFSEDPELTGRTGAALIRGIQSQGVAATAKHFVANDSETDRLTVDVRVPDRVLREVYLAPFERAVEAGVWLVMAAYNSVNGTTMTASPLLAEVLKAHWGFDGVVVSDWAAVRTTRETARAALDLAMPGPDSPWATSLTDAVRAGEVPEQAVDDKVRRLLRLAARVGALGPHRPRTVPARGHRGHRALLRRTVAAASVLLRNHDDVLPLDPAALSTVAVIGAHAATPRTQGGGSAEVHPTGTVTPLDALRSALRGRARVVHAPGPALDVPPGPVTPDHCTDPRSGAPGVLVRLLDGDGRELHAERRLSGRQPEPTLVAGAHTVEISALLRPHTTGTWTFGVGGFGRMTLRVDDRTLLDDAFPRQTDDPAIVHVTPPLRTARTPLTSLRPVHVVARRELLPGDGRATVLAAGPPAPDVRAALARRRPRPTARTPRSSSSAPPNTARARATTAPRWPWTAVTTTWCGPWPRPTRAPSRSSTAGAPSNCPGGTGSQPSCSAGSPARRPAPASPTSSSAAPNPGAACPPPGRHGSPTHPSPEPARHAGSCRTTRACTSGTGPGCGRAGNRRTGSATDSATPGGSTNPWTCRPWRRRGHRSRSGCTCATRVHGRDGKWSRSTSRAPAPRWNDRDAGSPGTRRSARRRDSG